MLSRFEAKMNALIAEGQAALNSTPVLQESDLREIDTPSPSLGIESSSSRSAAPHRSSRASQRLDSPFATASPFNTALSSSSGVPQSTSNPDQLASDSVSFLPEPVKRTFASPAQPQSLRHSQSAFDFNFRQTPAQDQASNRGSPFVFGGNAGTPNAAAGAGAAASPSLRAAASRRVTDFGGHMASPISRIPRSTSSLQVRKSLAGEQRPTPF